MKGTSIDIKEVSFPPDTEKISLKVNLMTYLRDNKKIAVDRFKEGEALVTRLLKGEEK